MCNCGKKKLTTVQIPAAPPQTPPPQPLEENKAQVVYQRKVMNVNKKAYYRNGK